jgi:hypothetical protein
MTRTPNGFTIGLDADGHLQWPLYQSNGKRAYDSTNHVVQATLQTLADRGPVEDKSGRASLELHKRAGKRDNVVRKMQPNVFTMRLQDMEIAGLIEREVVGKRTRRIALAIDTDAFPACWTPDTNGAAATNGTATEPEREDTPPDVQPLPPADEPVPDVIVLPGDTEPLGDVNYDLLAASLLAQVIEASMRAAESGMTADDAERVARDRYHFLSVQLTNAEHDRDKARHRIDVLERDLELMRGRVMSMRVERDEERRLREAADENVKRVLAELRNNGHAGYQLDDHQRRALVKMISEVPRSPHTVRNVT